MNAFLFFFFFQTGKGELISRTSYRPVPMRNVVLIAPMTVCDGSSCRTAEVGGSMQVDTVFILFFFLFSRAIKPDIETHTHVRARMHTLAHLGSAVM